jgi:hypothetical protein
MLVINCFSRVYCIIKQIFKENHGNSWVTLCGFIMVVSVRQQYHAFCFVFGMNLRAAQELRRVGFCTIY